MKRVVVAFEASDFPLSVMNFVTNMNNNEQVAVTGMFYPASVYAQLWKYAGTSGAVPISKSYDLNAEVDHCVDKFKQYCADHHLRHRITKDITDFGLDKLSQQSRFADLIVLSSEHFFNIPNSHKPSEYVKNLLQNAECPVVIVPDGCIFPTQNILAFDGSESSTKAIRHFAYLFPELAKNETVVVTFGSKVVDKEEMTKMKELISVHFPHHRFVHSETDSDKYFNWKNNNEPAIVVSGAFGRSMLSLLLKHSFITDVLKNRNMPVFISHK